MDDRMKIAVLGGSFNPIHNGHLKLVSYIAQNRIADEVWVMPCKKHPLDKFLDKEEDRVAMIKLALKGIEGARFSDFELTQNGKSYTFDTLRKLRKKYDYDFLWVMGSDILNQISTWYGYEYLQKEASFIVFQRKGYSLTNPGIDIRASFNYNEDSISSTNIRERVRKGKSIVGLVPASVEQYIIQNGLYR